MVCVWGGWFGVFDCGIEVRVGVGIIYISRIWCFWGFLGGVVVVWSCAGGFG